MEDNQNSRQPKWKATNMEDDQMEDNQNGRQSKWKTIKMENDQNGR